MATGVPSKTIEIHNKMVFELEKNITDDELDQLKQLLKDAPLTPVDIDKIHTVRDLFNCLRDKKFISYGNYDKLDLILRLVKPVLCDIVEKYTKDMSKIPENDLAKDPVIQMDKEVYRTKEGSAAFLLCTVYPLPERIEWKRDKKPPPETRVLNDNRKFFYGTSSPTLVIRNSSKTLDEAHYRCTLKCSGKEANGDIVKLQVSDDNKPTTSKGATMTTDDPTYSRLPVRKREIAQQIQEPVGEMKTSTRSKGKRRPISRLPVPKRETAQQIQDQNCRIEFKANIDHGKLINRPQSRKDISDVFHNSTCTKKRVKNVQMKEGCVLVCIDITPARNPSEPSSLHLAEEFKHHLLDVGTIRLTDESRTKLDVDKSSFKITPHNAPNDGIPFVNISHGKFTVLVGKTAIIQTYIIASPKATSIQWFKKENEKNIPIEIDNKRHFGGCDDCPTLIIRETNIDDQGQYICSATNSNGTGSSDISVLSVQSGGQKGKRDTTDTSDCRDSPSSKQPQYETTTTADRGSSSSTVSEALNDDEYSIMYDRKRDTIETSDCHDNHSSKQTQYKHNTTAGRAKPNTIETSACAQGAVMRPQNEVIQVQSRSKLSITSKGSGPNLIGENPTVVYNISLDRYKSTHAGDQRKDYSHDYQYWLKEQNRMTQEGPEQRMEKHKEMIMSSVKKSENMDQAEQRNIISQTENWIQEQRRISQFVTTKAFSNAKEKIKEKRFVVIRGVSGSGKTRLASELLDWLYSPSQENVLNCKKPLRLPSLQRWDKVISANSNLSILLDDLFGYNSDVSRDLTWWKQHGEMLNSIVLGKESANILIITLRNDIYKEYKSKLDCLSLFDDDNVIDLSSPEYNLDEEREKMLTTYTQTIDNFQPFSENEINQFRKTP